MTVVPVPLTEIDIDTEAELRDLLSGAEPAGDVVADLSTVTFCDSTGLQALIDARNRHLEAGGSFTVINVGRQVRGLIETMRLTDVLFGNGPPEDRGEVATVA